MNDVNFSTCKFSAEIVPYMYGELSASKSSVFESHLLACVECTDEFAAISSSRYEVYEWKKLDFDPLPTPRFEIPYNGIASVSWIDKLRAAFAPGWAVPVFAAAGLVIATMFAGIFLLSGDGEPMVAKSDNANVPAANSSIVETMPDPIEPAVSDPDKAGISPADPEHRPIRISGPRRTEPKQRPVKNTRPAPSRAVEVTPASAQNAPRLNDFTEDEDTSLRLAELFEDIETSD